MNEEDYKIAYENVMTANKMLEQEIERLKDSEEWHKKGFAELYKRIDEAIEWCEECYVEITNVIGEKKKFISCERIIEILRGEDDE